MKLARVYKGDDIVWAVITDGGAVDLTPLIGVAHGAVHQLLDPESLGRLEDFSVGRPAIATEGLR